MFSLLRATLRPPQRTDDDFSTGVEKRTKDLPPAPSSRLPHAPTVSAQKNRPNIAPFSRPRFPVGTPRCGLPAEELLESTALRLVRWARYALSRLVCPLTLGPLVILYQGRVLLPPRKWSSSHVKVDRRVNRSRHHDARYRQQAAFSPGT